MLFPSFSLNQLSPNFHKISEGKKAASRIYKIIDRVPLISNKTDAIRPDAFRGVIEFIDVSFNYPKDPSKTVFKRLSFKNESKDAAFIGASGSGKSTILQLIMRFYDPDEG